MAEHNCLNSASVVLTNLGKLRYPILNRFIRTSRPPRIVDA